MYLILCKKRITQGQHIYEHQIVKHQKSILKKIKF